MDVMITIIIHMIKLLLLLYYYYWILKSQHKPNVANLNSFERKLVKIENKRKMITQKHIYLLIIFTLFRALFCLLTCSQTMSQTTYQYQNCNSLFYIG